MLKNPWIPAPLFVNKEEEERTEKVNEDIPVNEMFLFIGQLTHPQTEVHLRMSIQISNDKTINDLINKRISDKSFNYKNLIKFDKIEFKNLFRKIIKLSLIEKQGSCCFQKDVFIGECQIKLDKLKSSSFIEDEYEFRSLDNNKQTSSKIQIKIKIRNSLVDKEFIIVSKTGIAVTRTFPAFKGENIGEIIDNENKPVNINKNLNKGVVKDKTDEKVKTNDQNKKTIPISNVEYSMSEFKPMELENPDHIDNLVSLKVLTFKIQKTEQEIKKIEGRAPATIRDKFLKMKVKKNNLESQMGDQITIENYLGLLRYQLDHDQKLQKYFESRKELEKMKLVSERIPLLISEIEEAINLIKTKK